jgi:hypothetical protein
MASNEDMGVKIRKHYASMKAIFVETSEMLSALVGQFERRGYKQRNSAIRSGSNALSQPGEWLPYFLQVLFSRPEPRTGFNAIGVNILFDDAYERQIELTFPVVFCGVLQMLTDPKAYSDALYQTCRTTKVNLVQSGAFQKANFPATSDYSQIMGYFLPLHFLVDRQALSSLIVNPCINLFEGKVEAVESAIKNLSVTPKDFLTR